MKDRTPPNIVFFCTDQQRADLLGCMGHPQIRTPNIDALARRGVLLRNLYVQGTVCMPSRASILTGRYPSQHGVIDNGFDLPQSETTLAHALRRNGYHTMLAGRSHLVCTQPHHILPDTEYYGFNECSHAQVYCGGTDPYNDYLRWIRTDHPDLYPEVAYANSSKRWIVPQRDDMGGFWTKDLDENRTLTAWVVQRSLEMIDAHRTARPDQPFFHWAGTWDPHSPFRVPPPWDRMYPPETIPLPVRTEDEMASLPPPLHDFDVRRSFESSTRNGKLRAGLTLDEGTRNQASTYWGTISHIDDQFGRLVAGLEQRGLMDNTVIVFTSDHGDMMGDHWFRAKGMYFFDGALKVPGVLYAPGLARPGRTSDALVETIDLMPTLLDLAGAPTPATVKGRSLAKLLEDEAVAHRPDVFSEWQGFSFSRPDVRVCSLQDDRYRIVFFQNQTYGQLYDRQADPDELCNLWDSPDHREAKQALTAKLLNRMMANLEPPDTREASW